MARIVGQREITACFSKYKTLYRLKISQITFFYSVSSATTAFTKL